MTIVLKDHFIAYSLPDIKELHPTVLTIANNGHHYHPHHGKLDVPDSSSKHSSKYSSKPLIKAKSRDDDLMASLEMMESLAADLPQNGNINLKRSYTVQHRRNQGSKEEGKKPPLPKLSHPPVNLNSSQNSNLKQVLSSRITSGSSPNLPLHSSPRLTRPKELFVRQITLPMDCYEVEETPIVPSPSLATPSTKTVIPPPIPARRYPRIYQHQINSHSSNTDESETERRRGSESSPKNFRSNESSPNNFRSNDSGILTSPSPPTDSGIALSPPTQPRIVTKPPDEFADAKNSKNSAVDTVSLSSSESDTTSGSRYDNVSVSTPKHLQNNRRFSNDTTGTSSTSNSKTSTLVAAAAEIAARKLNSPPREISTQTLEDGIDGDDEDEETSDSSSDILVLDSSSSNHEHEILEDDDDEIDCCEDDIDCEVSKNHDEIEISDHFRRRGNSHRRLKFKPTPAPVASVRHHQQPNRDSVSPYDNFTLPGAVNVSNSSSAISSRNSPSEGQSTAGFTKLLAAGPTSNV